jgi:hypothetical protein
MDTVLLFALPLVGGLIFCSVWNFTRWRVAREEGHRLYFRAVFYGAILFVVVATIRHQLESRFPWYSAMEAAVKESIKPMAKDPNGAATVADLTVTCFLAMLAGWPLAFLLNFGFRKKFWLRRAIKEDDFEAFLLDAADRELPIAATMDDRKVYVGYVVAGFDPAIGRKCILLLPLMSGYRHQETHTVNFTTFYTDLYGVVSVAGSAKQSKALPAPLEHLIAEDFITVLPADRIASCRLFDVQAYLEFQKSKPPAPIAPPVTPTPPVAG